MLCMNSPDKWPLITPDSGMAAMNTAGKRVRLDTGTPYVKYGNTPGKSPASAAPSRKRAR